MNEAKILLLLGGTGFIGRAVAEKYLNNKWQVIITTKALSIDDAKKKLILHGFDSVKLEKFIVNKSLLFIIGVDLNNKKWLEINGWLNAFKEIDLPPVFISRIINLVAETSGPADKIIKSSAEALNKILVMVKALKSQNKNVVFCNVGSTAERRHEKNLPPYELAKKIVRQKIEESGLCDYHFVVNYVKGKGEQKMKLAAPYLWNKLKFSYKWFFGFKVSVIDVDDLAEIIYHIPETAKDLPFRQKLIEVNVTNGELLFGEIIKNLLPKDKRVMPKLIIPARFESCFLRIYAFIAPRIRPNNQLIRRLADFAKRGSMSQAEQENLRTFKTAKEIKKLALDTTNYLVLERDLNLIIADKHRAVIYALRERNEEQLKRIVQKAIIPPD